MVFAYFTKMELCGELTVLNLCFTSKEAAERELGKHKEQFANDLKQDEPITEVETFADNEQANERQQKLINHFCKS